MKHYIIPIFIPHYGCPHQCVFCNQHKITGVATPATPKMVQSIITEHLQRINQPRHIEVAFYGGSFTALPLRLQSSLLEPAAAALERGAIHAIRLSTRPDCIDQQIIDNLANYGVSTVELGVQSLDNMVLKLAARGHTAEAVEAAVNIVKTARLKCGIQLMPGLPGEDWQSLLATANGVVKLSPAFVRIYPTLVIANTPLSLAYNQGQYQPLTLDEAVRRSAFLKSLFVKNHIKIIRIGLQATEELADTDIVLAGPYHPAFGEMVDSFLYRQILERVIQLVKPAGKLVVHHYSRDHSKVRGLANNNLAYFRRRYPNFQLELQADGQLSGELVVESLGAKYLINQAMLFTT